MTRIKPSSSTRSGLPRMASRAATCGRSRGKPVSFIAQESSTGGVKTGEDAALAISTITTSSAPPGPARRLPRGEKLSAIGITMLIEAPYEYTLSPVEGKNQKRFVEDFFFVHPNFS